MLEAFLSEELEDIKHDTLSVGVVSSLKHWQQRQKKNPLSRPFVGSYRDGVVLWRLDTVSAWHVANKFPEIWNQDSISSTYRFIRPRCREETRWSNKQQVISDSK